MDKNEEFCMKANSMEKTANRSSSRSQEQQGCFGRSPEKSWVQLNLCGRKSRHQKRRWNRAKSGKVCEIDQSKKSKFTHVNIQLNVATYMN